MGEVKIISYSPQLGYPRKFKGTRGDKIHARSAGDMKTFCGLTPYIIARQGSGVRKVIDRRFKYAQEKLLQEAGWSSRYKDGAAG